MTVLTMRLILTTVVAAVAARGSGGAFPAVLAPPPNNSGRPGPSLSARSRVAADFCTAAAELCAPRAEVEKAWGRGAGPPSGTLPAPGGPSIRPPQPPLPHSKIGPHLDAESLTVFEKSVPDSPLAMEVRKQPMRMRRLIHLKEQLQRNLDIKKSLMKVFEQTTAKPQASAVIGKVESRSLSTQAEPSTSTPTTVASSSIGATAIVQDEGCWNKAQDNNGVLASKIVSLSYRRNLTVPEAKQHCLNMPECNAVRWQRAGRFAHFLRIETDTPLLRLMLAYPHQEGWIYAC